MHTKYMNEKSENVTISFETFCLHFILLYACSINNTVCEFNLTFVIFVHDYLCNTNHTLANNEWLLG